jgi:hypothetical protein
LKADEWGDNLSLLLLTYAFDISVKVYSIDSSSPLIKEGALIARPKLSVPSSEKQILLLHSPGHWQAIVALDAADALMGPVVSDGTDSFVVLGIPPDGACQFGAFIMSAVVQDLLTEAEVIRLASQEQETDSETGSDFHFVPAPPDVLRFVEGKLTHTATKVLKRAPPEKLSIQNIFFDFYQFAQHVPTGFLLFPGVRVEYKGKSWALRNLFYSRNITKCHIMTFLSRSDQDVFVALKDEHCPVLPKQPYECVSPADMADIQKRPMTAAIEAYYADEFKNQSGSQPVAHSSLTPSPATPVSSCARPRRTSATQAGSKRARVDNDPEETLDQNAQVCSGLGMSRFRV